MNIGADTNKNKEEYIFTHVVENGEINKIFNWTCLTYCRHTYIYIYNEDSEKREPHYLMHSVVERKWLIEYFII